MNKISDSAMFRPPINRAMRALDRSFFQKTIPISAARIRDNKQISKCRSELGDDLLKLDRFPSVRSVRDPEGNEAKALLLRPGVKQDGDSASFFLVVFLLGSRSIKNQELRYCQMHRPGAPDFLSWSTLPRSACCLTISS